jgi:hypothetical protein
MGFLKITDTENGQVKYSNYDDLTVNKPAKKNAQGEIIEDAEQDIIRQGRETTAKEDKFLADFSKGCKIND